MAGLVKRNGIWVNASDIYVRRSGVWTLVQQGYVKINGVWTLGHAKAPAPLAPPVLSLQVIRDSYATNIPGGQVNHVYQYIKVGARFPTGSNEPSLRRIRVLYGGTSNALTNQFGDTFVSEPTNGYPNEAFSEWYFNVDPVNESGVAFPNAARDDSSIETFKNYPVNATVTHDNLPGNNQYYFGAWCLDQYGQWSAGTFSNIFVPKPTSDLSTDVKKEAFFYPIASGSITGSTYTEGDLITRPAGPTQWGVWYFGNQITNSVGSGGAPTITTAKVRITRADDAGQATGNVYAFWHTHGPLGEIVPTGDRMNITLIGTIAKGQTKVFDLPSSFNAHYNTEVKGLGLAYNTGANNASDYITVIGSSSDYRSGELHLTWTENV